MHYHETPPPTDLADIVRCTWRLVGDSSGIPDPALPDGSPELIVSLGDRFEHVDSYGAVTRQPEVFLVGQITGPMLVRPTGRIDLVAVRFEAHGAASFHRPMKDLTDRWIDLSELTAAPGAESLAALCRGEDPERAVLSWLSEIVAAAPPVDPAVATTVRSIRTSGGMVELSALAAELGVTPRTLQRRFLSEVGIVPKQLARIVRFQRVFSSWRADRSSLSRVAFECGYYDQSHLTRDFRERAGMPPAAFLADIPEFTGYMVEGGGIGRASRVGDSDSSPGDGVGS